MATGDGAGFGGLFSGDSQIANIVMWTTFQQIISAALSPFLTELQSTANAAHPLQPLSPADLADMVIRGVMTEADAAPIAAKSGISAADFHSLVLDNGEPPGMDQVLEWWRRGFLPWDDGGPTVPSVERAIKTSRLKDYWADVIKASQFVPLTPADAVNAWVRNQIAEADALKYLYQNGVAEPEARTLYNTSGRPPSPLEAAQLVRRGLIPVHGTGPGVVSFQQAIYEGDTKDKWEPLFEAFIETVLSPFQIHNLQKAGAITGAVAFNMYREAGVPMDVANALVESGSTTKVAAVKQRSLSLVEKMYAGKLITHDQAAEYLHDLGYSPDEATDILLVNDQELELRTISNALTAVRTRYLGRKITRDDVVKILGELGMPDAQVTELVALWDIEQQAEVRTLTEAQILDAAEYGVRTNEWVISQLKGLGYSDADAWVLLQVKLKGPLPGDPNAQLQPPPASPPAAPTTGA